MSSIFIDEEAESIRPESSVSHQVEQFSVTGLSESKPEPVSIGEYFIVKDTPECLEGAQRFLKKRSEVCHLRDQINFIGYPSNLGRLDLEPKES